MEENTSQHNPFHETRCISLSSSSAILQKKLKNLEKDYQIFAKTMKSQESHKKRNSFDHVCSTRRSLSMSYCSPSIVTQSSGQVWRVRENELAMEEIRRERFESGNINIRGRRLFEDEHSVCDEKIVQVEEVVKKVNQEIKMIKLGDDDVTCSLAYGKKKEKKKKLIIIILIFALMVLVIGIGITLLLGGFDGNASDFKFVISPT